MSDREPRTAAGRVLLTSLHAQARVNVPIEDDAAAILAIEAEAHQQGALAAAAEIAALREALWEEHAIVRSRWPDDGPHVGCAVCAAVAPSDALADALATAVRDAASRGDLPLDPARVYVGAATPAVVVLGEAHAAERDAEVAALSCTFHRPNEPLCGRIESHPVHVRGDERMRHGGHVWRHDARDAGRLPRPAPLSKPDADAVDRAHVHEWGHWLGIHGQRTTLDECLTCGIARSMVTRINGKGITPEFWGGPETGYPQEYRKTATVFATPALTDGEIETPEGVMRFAAGDYIVTDNPPTHAWPVKRAVFEATYVGAD